MRRPCSAVERECRLPSRGESLLICSASLRYYLPLPEGQIPSLQGCTDRVGVRGALTYPPFGDLSKKNAVDPHAPGPAQTAAATEWVGYAGQTYLTSGLCSRSPASDFGSWQDSAVIDWSSAWWPLLLLLSSSFIVFRSQLFRCSRSVVWSALNRRRGRHPCSGMVRCRRPPPGVLTRAETSRLHLHGLAIGGQGAHHGHIVQGSVAVDSTTWKGKNSCCTQQHPLSYISTLNSQFPRGRKQQQKLQRPLR